MISVDYYGPLPAPTGGVRYLLVVEDVFSQFVKLYPVKRATATITVRRICSPYFKQYGIPEEVITDHGTQFISKAWQTAMQARNVRHILSSIRHPQSNPVERTNRESGRILRTATPTRPWLKWFPHIQEQVATDNDKYDRKLELAYNRMSTKAQRRRERGNAGKNHTEYQVGERVLLRVNLVSNAADRQIAKFFHLYEGPYVITAKKGPVTYSINYERNGQLKGAFRASSFRRYKTKKDQQSTNILLTLTSS